MSKVESDLVRDTDVNRPNSDGQLKGQLEETSSYTYHIVNKPPTELKGSGGSRKMLLGFMVKRAGLAPYVEKQRPKFKNQRSMVRSPRG